MIIQPREIQTRSHTELLRQVSMTAKFHMTPNGDTASPTGKWWRLFLDARSMVTSFKLLTLVRQHESAFTFHPTLANFRSFPPPNPSGSSNAHQTNVEAFTATYLTLIPTTSPLTTRPRPPLQTKKKPAACFCQRCPCKTGTDPFPSIKQPLFCLLQLFFFAVCRTATTLSVKSGC